MKKSDGFATFYFRGVAALLTDGEGFHVFFDDVKMCRSATFPDMNGMSNSCAAYSFNPYLALHLQTIYHGAVRFHS